jgi:hypothetical protein
MLRGDQQRDPSGMPQFECGLDIRRVKDLFNRHFVCFHAVEQLREFVMYF